MRGVGWFGHKHRNSGVFELISVLRINKLPIFGRKASAKMWTFARPDHSKASHTEPELAARTLSLPSGNLPCPGALSNGPFRLEHVRGEGRVAALVGSPPQTQTSLALPGPQHAFAEVPTRHFDWSTTLHRPWPGKFNYLLALCPGLTLAT